MEVMEAMEATRLEGWGTMAATVVRSSALAVPAALQEPPSRDLQPRAVKVATEHPQVRLETRAMVARKRKEQQAMQEPQEDRADGCPWRIAEGRSDGACSPGVILGAIRCRAGSGWAAS